MRTLLLAGAAFAALMSPASAQTVDWSGGYIGVHGGYALSAPGVTGTDLGEVDLDDGGFLAGVYFGHDWQDGGLVYGLMGEFDYLAIRNVNQFLEEEFSDDVFGKSDNYNYDVDWLASVRGRMGTPFTENLLVTGSLGVVAAGVSASLASTETVFGISSASFDSVDAIVWGSVIGIGAEYRLSQHWSMKADYSYYLFQSIDLQSVTGGTEIKPKFGVVKVGVAYRF